MVCEIYCVGFLRGLLLEQLAGLADPQNMPVGIGLRQKHTYKVYQHDKPLHQLLEAPMYILTKENHGVLHKQN